MGVHNLHIISHYLQVGWWMGWEGGSANEQTFSQSENSWILLRETLAAFQDKEPFISYVDKQSVCGKIIY